MSTPMTNDGHSTSGAPVPGSARSVDPQRIRTEVDTLLSRLGKLGQDSNDQHGAGVIPQKTQILEQAHEVLVQALASVDRA